MSAEPPQGYRYVGAGRVREVVGLGYRDLTEGLTIEHRPGRTITETDNTLITTLSGNDAPLHLDAVYAAHTPWGRILVCSAVTLAVIGGMTARSVSGLTTANLGMADVQFTHPVFVGDTLYAETEITSRRTSRSHPDTGVITCRTTGLNQDGAQVVAFTRTFLLPLDPGTIRTLTNY
ncbi:MaoC family dehydratase [Streptomyces sp. CBMA123]|uniref:MaoC family dehydratase n=1 Tax=Streptomyces sp. CBMA123 TaxID=1896313 RepID=UPI0016619EF6|nr:MaoC family dehydratase [Streptomyces sp. CBMA123]MBD0693924.1 molybdenum cofactor biosynthesis protein MoeC [Streptomyces sp. CBMA123]